MADAAQEFLRMNEPNRNVNVRIKRIDPLSHCLAMPLLEPLLLI